MHINFFTVLYEVDIINPLIFYIYDYNLICNNCKSMHNNLYDPLKMVCLNHRNTYRGILRINYCEKVYVH
jgi:hypothetical protein